MDTLDTPLDPPLMVGYGRQDNVLNNVSLGTLRLLNLGMGNVLILSCIVILRAHDNRIVVVLQPEI